jgi:peptide/nickel transport system permease protein
VQTLALEPAAATPVVVEKAATKRLGVVGWIAIIWLVAVVGSAIFASLIPIAKPDQKFLALAGQGPQVAHPFGLDGIGQDMFSRVIYGARASLLVSVASVLFGLIGGGVLGLIAGYYRGRVDTILSYVFNTFLAVPQLVLALAIVAVFASDPAVSVGTRELWLVISIGIVSIPIIGRITRASTLAWSQREFVLAARSMGAKNRRIIVRDVLPNVLPAMFSIALLAVAVVIVLEGGLSILGVGIPTSTPSWGNLVATGRNELTKIVGASPQVIFAPSIVIFFTVLSLNYLGDVVRARFDVRESAL